MLVTLVMLVMLVILLGVDDAATSDYKYVCHDDSHLNNVVWISIQPALRSATDVTKTVSIVHRGPSLFRNSAGK